MRQFRRIHVLLIKEVQRKRGIDMGQFVFGAFAGIVMCAVVLMVRCVLWYERQHPEDDYWHRLAPGEEKEKGGG